ncbi:MAG: AAA family ATPase, partial [Candidatus Portnoybacteria bacterium]|nr:AAA family ATPase [Candidatus Portnoybacteria bacterium]
MPKIYITGVSGTGKSTLAKELNRLGIFAIDMDTVEGLCHWRNKKTGERTYYYSGIGRDWIEAHEWLCDIEKLKKLLKKDGLVAVLGLASNQDEYLNLFDKVFLLHCGEKTFLHRLNTRKGKDEFARDPSEQEHILSWYK